MLVIEPPSAGSIDLAKVNYPISMPGAKREDALIVAAMRSGSVFVGNERVTPEELGVRFMTDKHTQRERRSISGRWTCEVCRRCWGSG
jgi:hypothetical protein